LVGEELIEKIRDAHVIGIRSKTKLTKQVLAEAKNLLAIGCFCIGTNQVDLQAAAKQGVCTLFCMCDLFIYLSFHLYRLLFSTLLSVTLVLLRNSLLAKLLCLPAS
jgi:hypothetical protein